MAAKKVPHIKTKEAEVSIQMRGRAMEITIRLRPKLAEQLAFRLSAPKRHQKAIKKRRKL